MSDTVLAQLQAAKDLASQALKSANAEISARADMLRSLKKIKTGLRQDVVVLNDLLANTRLKLFEVLDSPSGPDRDAAVAVFKETIKGYRQEKTIIKVDLDTLRNTIDQEKQDIKVLKKEKIQLKEDSVVTLLELVGGFLEERFIALDVLDAQRAELQENVATLDDVLESTRLEILDVLDDPSGPARDAAIQALENTIDATQQSKASINEELEVIDTERKIENKLIRTLEKEEGRLQRSLDKMTQGVNEISDLGSEADDLLFGGQFSTLLNTEQIDSIAFGETTNLLLSEFQSSTTETLGTIPFDDMSAGLPGDADNPFSVAANTSSFPIQAQSFDI